MITEQRLGLARLLEGLSETEWEQPSLCVGWRVRDVAAHVAMAPQVPGLGSMLADGIRARGNFHRLNHDVAVRHAARPTREIVAELRTYADSRRLPVVTNYRNISSTCSSTLRTSLFRWAGIIRCHPRLRGPVPTGCGLWDGRSGPATGCAGCGLASDTDWSAGAGVELRGPIR